jgi:hypothetical protein
MLLSWRIRRSWPVTWLLVACALLLLSPTALAQDEDAGEEKPPAPKAAPKPAPAAEDIDEGPAPVTQETKEKARFHFRKGIKLLNEEAWAPALAEFLRSRELYATRVATNNAAVSLRKLQRYDEALDMYETLLRDFEVKPSQRAAAQKEIAELRGLVGTLDIVGAEPGAQIVISSADRGQYPPVKPIRVPAGKHVVRIYKEGFEPYQTTVDVAGGQIVSVEASMPQLKESGRLRVAERTGRIVNVLLDGVVVGKTPWEGRLGVGDHTVQLRGEGKLGSQPAKAVVKPEDLTTLTLLAEDLNAQLRIDPTPPGAIISVDGVDVGSGVWLGRLKSGPHKIEARLDGFLSKEQSVRLGTGKRELLAIELERDEDAPMWRKPSKWMFDVNGGLVVMPTLGGDLDDSCDSDCTPGVGLGALALFHAGYELGSGLGFGVELGYVVTAQSYDNRPANLNPNGLSEGNPGRVTDDLRMQGFLAGAAIGYHIGEDYPVLLRLGAGVMVGEVRDERIGDFANRDGTTYRSFGVADFQGATYFYLDPGIKAGVRFAENWELSGSVQALMLIALSQPTFDNTIPVAASNDGIGTYSDEAVMGSFIIGVVPGANLRYHFE